MGVEDVLAEGAAAAVDEGVIAPEPTAERADSSVDTLDGGPTDNEGEGAREEAGPSVYDYEAERAKKLAYRASLTEEDIARIRKHEKPANYAFGRKVAEGVEGASPSGDPEERERTALEIERDQRMEQAARVDDWQGRLDGMSHEERVRATLDCLGRRPSYARVLRAVLDYCREERDSGEVESYIETLPDFAANRQSARRYVFFLMRTGALAEVGYDADGNPVDERAVQAVQDELASTPTSDTDADTDGTEEPAQAEGASDTEPAEASGELASGPAAQEGFEIAEPVVDPSDSIVAWRLSTTAAGVEALEATDARNQLKTLLADQVEDRYAAYLDVLTFCEEPRALAEISEFLIGNPGLEIDDRGVVNMQPNAYIGKLDKAGALVWTGEGWQTTKEALQVLDTI